MTNYVDTIIDEMLKELNIPFSYSGRDYIAYSLKLMHESSTRLSNTYIFNKVAEVYGTSRDNVDNNIRYCLNKCDYSSELATRIFRLSARTGAVKPKEALQSMLRELQCRLQD